MGKKHLAFWIAAGFAVILAILGFIIINNKLNSLSMEIYDRYNRFSDEISESSQDMDLVKQNLMILSQDTNVLRELLNLPPREYPSLENETNSASDDEESTVDENILFFKALEIIMDRRKTEELMSIFSAFMEGEELSGLLDAKEYTVNIGSSGLSAEITGKSGMEFVISYINPEMKIESFLGEELIFNHVNEIEGFIEKNRILHEEHRLDWPQALLLFDTLRADEGVSALLESRRLHWGEFSESDMAFTLLLEKQEGTSPGIIEFNKTVNSWSISGSLNTHNEDFGSGREGYDRLIRSLISSVTDYDSRTPEEIAEDDSRNKLLQLSADEGFRAYLETLKSSISEDFRQDHYYHYLDILDVDGNSFGSLAVQKNTGEIYLMDRDDVVITSLKTLGMNEGIRVKKKIVLPDDYGSSSPIIFGDDDIAFVLIGANEANTDTMMVVHLNEISGKGTIITVPRDLYYKGRKINSIYPTFGPSVLLKTLSEITGLPVKRYMFIDMFAFADVVDILGGIDIILEEPLIDPTYRIKENGKWSTLHYEAGPVHLGGIEALRVARSRHTSSDFGRARRQQMILLSLKDRLMELNATDAGKLVELADSLMNYVRTDFSVIELINLFTRFRDAPYTQHVLSWDNVLYNTYSNLYLLEENTEVDENFNRGAWILLPVNNDWEVIKWFVRQVITEEAHE